MMHIDAETAQHLAAEVARLRGELAASQAENARYRAVLSLYAAEEHWNSFGLGPLSDAWAFEEDGYTQAQAALATPPADAGRGAALLAVVAAALAYTEAVDTGANELALIGPLFASARALRALDG